MPKALAEIRSLARSHTRTALNVLVGIMRSKMQRPLRGYPRPTPFWTVVGARRRKQSRMATKAPLNSSTESSASLSILRIPTASIFEPLLTPSRYKGAYGGRGSGKSHFFGELLVETCQAARGISAVCIREAQRTLAQSSKRLIESKIAALGLNHQFRIFNDKIETPGDGVIIFRGMQDHTSESIKSLEGFRIAWIDEAQNLSARSLSLLRPTIRAEGSEMWASWNPRRYRRHHRRADRSRSEGEPGCAARGDPQPPDRPGPGLSLRAISRNCRRRPGLGRR
jgi:hypothetical protein